MADDATTQKIAALLIGQQNPSVLDMAQYIGRNPDLAAANRGQVVNQPMYSPDGHEILPEAAAVADPFGVSQIQRWLGSDLPTMVRINEGHGLMKKEIDRLRGSR